MKEEALNLVTLGMGFNAITGKPGNQAFTTIDTSATPKPDSSTDVAFKAITNRTIDINTDLATTFEEFKVHLDALHLTATLPAGPVLDVNFTNQRDRAYSTLFFTITLKCSEKEQLLTGPAVLSKKAEDLLASTDEPLNVFVGQYGTDFINHINLGRVAVIVFCIHTDSDTESTTLTATLTNLKLLTGNLTTTLNKTLKNTRYTVHIFTRGMDPTQTGVPDLEKTSSLIQIDELVKKITAAQTVEPAILSYTSQPYEVAAATLASRGRAKDLAELTKTAFRLKQTVSQLMEKIKEYLFVLRYSENAKSYLEDNQFLIPLDARDTLILEFKALMGLLANLEKEISDQQCSAETLVELGGQVKVLMTRMDTVVTQFPRSVLLPLESISSHDVSANEHRKGELSFDINPPQESSSIVFCIKTDTQQILQARETGLEAVRLAAVSAVHTVQTAMDVLRNQPSKIIEVLYYARLSHAYLMRAETAEALITKLDRSIFTHSRSHYSFSVKLNYAIQAAYIAQQAAELTMALKVTMQSGKVAGVIEHGTALINAIHQLGNIVSFISSAISEDQKKYQKDALEQMNKVVSELSHVTPVTGSCPVEFVGFNVKIKEISDLVTQAVKDQASAQTIPLLADRALSSMQSVATALSALADLTDLADSDISEAFPPNILDSKSKENFQTRLDCFATKHNLQLKEIYGDGNCFFEAIAFLLNKRNGTKFTKKDIRKNGVAYLLNHPSFDVGFDKGAELGTLKEYTKKMRKDGEYAEGPIIEAVALHYKISIQIINFRGNGKVDVIKPINAAENELFILARISEEDEKNKGKEKTPHYNAFFSSEAPLQELFKDDDAATLQESVFSSEALLQKLFKDDDAATLQESAAGKDASPVTDTQTPGAAEVGVEEPLSDKGSGVAATIEAEKPPSEKNIHAAAEAKKIVFRKKSISLDDAKDISAQIKVKKESIKKILLCVTDSIEKLQQLQNARYATVLNAPQKEALAKITDVEKTLKEIKDNISEVLEKFSQPIASEVAEVNVAIKANYEAYRKTLSDLLTKVLPTAAPEVFQRIVTATTQIIIAAAEEGAKQAGTLASKEAAAGAVAIAADTAVANAVATAVMQISAQGIPVATVQTIAQSAARTVVDAARIAAGQVASQATNEAAAKAVVDAAIVAATKLAPEGVPMPAPSAEQTQLVTHIKTALLTLTDKDSSVVNIETALQKVFDAIEESLLTLTQTEWQALQKQLSAIKDLANTKKGILKAAVTGIKDYTGSLINADFSNLFKAVNGESSFPTKTLYDAGDVVETQIKSIIAGFNKAQAAALAAVEAQKKAESATKTIQHLLESTATQQILKDIAEATGTTEEAQEAINQLAKFMASLVDLHKDQIVQIIADENTKLQEALPKVASASILQKSVSDDLAKAIATYSLGQAKTVLGDLEGTWANTILHKIKQVDTVGDGKLLNTTNKQPNIFLKLKKHRASKLSDFWTPHEQLMPVQKRNKKLPPVSEGASFPVTESIKSAYLKPIRVPTHEDFRVGIFGRIDLYFPLTMPKVSLGTDTVTQTMQRP